MKTHKDLTMHRMMRRRILFEVLSQELPKLHNRSSVQGKPGRILTLRTKPEHPGPGSPLWMHRFNMALNDPRWTLPEWQWFKPWERFRAEWTRLKTMRKAAQKRRLYRFTNDIRATRSQKVIGELPDRKT